MLFVFLFKEVTVDCNQLHLCQMCVFAAKVVEHL